MIQEELGADMYRLASLFERWNTNNRINEPYHRWRLTVMKTQEVSSLPVIEHRRLKHLFAIKFNEDQDGLSPLLKHICD